MTAGPRAQRPSALVSRIPGAGSAGGPGVTGRVTPLGLVGRAAEARQHPVAVGHHKHQVSPPWLLTRLEEVNPRLRLRLLG